MGGTTIFLSERHKKKLDKEKNMLGLKEGGYTGILDVVLHKYDRTLMPKLEPTKKKGKPRKWRMDII
tara:strand:+ start:724 stop:924 length:201 start_codon:yes stop_codon:yes gene_type:complete